MHFPSARALSRPRPLLHRPCVLIKSRNAHTTGMYYLIIVDTVLIIKVKLLLYELRVVWKEQI